MAFRGIPFDSKMVLDNFGTYEDRQVFSEDIAKYFGFVSSDGICLKDDEELTNQLLVEAGTDSEVILNPGTIKIQGRMGWITEPESLYLNPGGSLPRIDSAVVELNLSTSVRGFVFKIVEGEESSNPEPPTLVRTPDVWQMGLGNFYRIANSTTLGEFTDTRLDSERCGVSKIATPNIGIDTLTLWQESYPDITNLNDILYLIGSEGLPEEFGGTHSKSLPNARQNLNFIGVDPIASEADDIPENWVALGTGHAYISGDGKLKNKPANNGIVESTVYGTVVIQVFTSWATGTTGRKWSRVGNNTYGWTTSWTQLLDERNTAGRIVDTGTIGTWRWVKYEYANGEKYYDAWMSYYGPIPITTATGNLFRSAYNPADDFIEAVGSTYIVYAFAECNGGDAWATIANHGENALSYVLMSPNSQTGDKWVNIYVRGTWA